MEGTRWLSLANELSHAENPRTGESIDEYEDEQPTSFKRHHGDALKKYVTEAERLKQKMLQTDVSQLADARATAKEAIDAYDKAKEKCKEASKKYEEASKLQIKDNFKEYLGLKVKEYDKCAELVETAKGTPQALIDAKSRPSFVSMANANNERVDRLSKEADELGAQSDKLQKDNANIFKS